MNFLRAGIAQQLYDLLAGCASHYGIVDQHDPLILDHPAIGIVLQLDAHVADGIRRLDEGAAYIVVADDAELEGQAGGLGEADRGRRAAVGHRHYDIGIDRVLEGELGANLLPHFIDVAALDRRIRTREIDILENAEPRFLFRTGTGSPLPQR